MYNVGSDVEVNMTEPVKGKCPDCFKNGAPVEALDKIKILVDGILCGPCYRKAHPPKRKPAPKSEGYKQRRADEYTLQAVLGHHDKGTHFLKAAAEELGWPIKKAEGVYRRLYDRGYRREPIKGGPVKAALVEGPKTMEELRKITGMTDGGIFAALRLLDGQVKVFREGRKRIYLLEE